MMKGKFIIPYSIQKQSPEVFHRNTCPQLYLKRDSGMFSCEFFEIFKNNFFTENLWTTASEHNILRSIHLQMLYKTAALNFFPNILEKSFPRDYFFLAIFFFAIWKTFQNRLFCKRHPGGCI